MYEIILAEEVNRYMTDLRKAARDKWMQEHPVVKKEAKKRRR